MYTPLAFVVEDEAELHEMIRQCHLANFVTVTRAGPMVSPLPMYFEAEEGDRGVLYAHLARANPQWQAEVVGHGLAVFMGPDAYVTPSWYASKAEHGKVVPTWNYTAVHASGPVEFFGDPDRLLDVVKRVTAFHESTREAPWAVTDAPEAFVRSQLRGIVGIRMPVVDLQGKRKISQNRPQEDRAGVALGMQERAERDDLKVAAMVPL